MSPTRKQGLMTNDFGLMTKRVFPMKEYPALRRWAAMLATVVVFSTLVILAAWSNNGGGKNDEPKKTGGDKPSVPGRMFGGHKSRNMVNLMDRNTPVEFDVEKNKFKNILWEADLGSKAYGGPIVADGKVFIGTNNEKPRDSKIVGDKGIMMCFDAKTGKFLWQHVHNKLPGGQVNDWPKEGICSSPIVEGSKLWYVSNRCEVVCSTTDGKILWTLDMIGKLGVFPHNLAVCSPLIAGNAVFVVTANGVDEGHINIPAPKAPSFLALDKNKGTVLWQNNDPSANLVGGGKGVKLGQKEEVAIKKLVDAGKLLMHGQWSSPVYEVANGQPQVIFPGGDGWLRAFEPKTGDLIWKFDCNPKQAIYKLGGKGTRSDFVSTPVVYDNKLYIGVGQDPEHDEGIGHYWCIDITKKGDVSTGTIKDKEGKLLEVFDPKDPVNKHSALVWHYGEDPLEQEAGAEELEEKPQLCLRPYHEHRIGTRWPGLHRRTGRLHSLPGREDRRAILDTLHESADLGFHLLGR